jgi:ATP-dependent Lon protease
MEFGEKPDFFDEYDIHVHVPAGAIPKDGPSAGIAIATSLVSLISDQKVDKLVAMTGEITLRGRVLPIGGLKEKALGALNAGIKTVVIPEKNKKDLYDIPVKIKRKMKFIPVKNMAEVLEIALIKNKKTIKKRTRKTKSKK